MKAKALTLLMVVALMGAVVAAPMRAEAAAPATSTGISIPLTSLVGTAVGTSTITSAVLNITRFANQGGTLTAIGTVTTTLTDALGAVTTVTQAVALPVLSGSGTCQILHLVLGPLDLSLLGLNVHLNQVVLDITAQSGPGNLLGNLLCAVAHLLDNGGPLASLTNVLNNLLANL